MRNENKILEQNSLASGIIIKFVSVVAVTGFIVWLVSQISIPLVMAALAIGYLIIRLIMKLFLTLVRVVFSILFTAILIAFIIFLI